MSVSFQNPLTRRLPSPSTTQDARASAIPPNAPDTPAALNAVLELTSTPAPQEPTAPRKPSVPTVMACFLLGMNTAQLHHDKRMAKSLSQPRRNWMPSAATATEYQELHTQPPASGTTSEQLQPWAQGSDTNVTKVRKWKGLAVMAHEENSSQAFPTPSPPSSSTPPTSSRPRRATVLGKNLNLANLSAQSIEANDMDIDDDDSC